MNAVLQNPMLAPITDGWPDDALPLQAELEAPAPFQWLRCRLSYLTIRMDTYCEPLSLW